MENTKQLKYTPDPNKFDLRTHVWNAQGQLVNKNLYRAFLRDGTTYYERPVNSGNLWYADNKPAGRVECEFNAEGHIISKCFKIGVPHDSYAPPPSEHDKLQYALQKEQLKNTRLQAELAAIRAERDTMAQSKEGTEVKVPTEKIGPSYQTESQWHTSHSEDVSTMSDTFDVPTLTKKRSTPE